jgi:beta-lactamase class A
MPKIGLAAALLIGAVAATGCGSQSSAHARTELRTTAQSNAGLPSTSAGRQLAWALALVNSGRTPTAAEFAAHFSPAFLKAFPPAKLIAGIEPIVAGKPYRYVRMLTPPNNLQLVARLDGDRGASLSVSIAVANNPAHLIDALFFQAAASSMNNWRVIDTGLTKLAGQASMLAAEVQDGRLKTVHALYPNRVGAIGSAFKLYVLGALGQAIENGTASWQEKLAIRNAWKSISSGVMQNEPAGKRFTLLHYAQLMIAISDNTAADHLIGRLGRGAVERELVRLGNHSPGRDIPFLTTRENTILKADAPASLMSAYARAGSKQRSRLLARVDAIPLSIDALSGKPRSAGSLAWLVEDKPLAVSTIEWFASPADLGRAMVGLQQFAHRPGLAPIRAILSKTPGVPLDPKIWRYAAYKGGSEPGVLCFSWYLERRDGRAFVLAIVLNDSKRTVENDLISPISIAQAAMALLARS